MGCVMNDQNIPDLLRPFPHCLTMWLEDLSCGKPIVIDESIKCFELCLRPHCLRKTDPRVPLNRRRDLDQPFGPTLVTQLSSRKLFSRTSNSIRISHTIFDHLQTTKSIKFPANIGPKCERSTVQSHAPSPSTPCAWPRD